MKGKDGRLMAYKMGGVTKVPMVTMVTMVKMVCLLQVLHTSQSMHIHNNNLLNNNNNINNNYIHNNNNNNNNIHNNNNNNIHNNNNNGPQVNRRSARQKRVDPASYLQKLGYLPGSDLETGALRTEEEFSGALKKFQKFANVPLTGKLDEATKRMMDKSRCGVQDMVDGSTEITEVQNHLSHQPPSSTAPHQPQGYVLGPSKWQKRYIKYRFLNFTPDLSRETATDSISRAFKMWSDTANLKFEEVTHGYADIYILFAREYHQDGYPFDRLGGTLAHAFFPGEGKGGDVHFDDDELWTEKSINGTNLFIVGAHEIGHALGLAHSYEQRSLMYPWYKGYTPDYRLSYDDIYAIQTIYGPKITGTSGQDGEHAQTTSTTTTTTTRKIVTTASHHHHHHHHSNPPVTLPPFITSKDCDIRLDAVSIIRADLFFFQGKKFYRFNKNRNLTSGATDITIFWTHLPKDLKKVDAVFESNNHIYFFIGKRYWKFYGNSKVSGFPREGKTIDNFNLPNTLTHIDAAFRWKHNERVYLISGDMYWRLDEKDEKVEYGYPRDMSMWGGVKLPVDAAFTDVNGVTYFFKGPHFWPFNSPRMQLRNKHPHEIATHWLKCPSKSLLKPPVLTAQESFNVPNSSSATFSLSIFLYVFIVIGNVVNI